MAFSCALHILRRNDYVVSIFSRSFLKYSAVAAVAVAGASLFTGCESTGDSYNLVRDGAGTLTILQIQTDLGTYSDKDKKFVLDAPKVGATSFVFPLKITNGRTNALPVNPGNFKVTFTSADGKTVKKYIGTDLVVDNSLRETNLKTGSSVSGTVPSPTCLRWPRPMSCS